MSGNNCASWLGLAEVAPSTLNSLTNETGDHRGSSWSVAVIQNVHQHKSDSSRDDKNAQWRRWLTTTIVQVVPSTALNEAFIYIHPILYDVVQQSVTSISPLKPETMIPSSEKDLGDPCSSNVDFSKLFSLASIPALTVMNTETSMMEMYHEQQSMSASWKVTVVDHVCDLPLHSRISICILQLDDSDDDEHPIFPIVSQEESYEEETCSSLQNRIAESLLGRYIVEGGVLVVSWMNTAMAVVVITHIGKIDGHMEEESSNNNVYRIGTDCNEYSVCLDTKMQPPGILTTDHQKMNKTDQVNSSFQEEDCPGYEALLQELLHYTSMMTVPRLHSLDRNGAAASGILLTGCAGVGKTHLASCLTHHLRHGDSACTQVHWASVHDLLLRASHETNLIHYLMPSSTASTLQGSGSSWIIIIDDLYVLELSSDLDDAAMDMELLLVRNAILQAMDQQPPNCLFLGLCRSANQLPNELLRIGRLEKQLVMHPPTQAQRKAILMKLLSSSPEMKPTSTTRRDTLERWAEILAASPTAGCVAADLRRLGADALTRAMAKQIKHTEENAESIPIVDALSWEDLREAARSCIPSQLAQLDVAKPTYWLTEHSTGPEYSADETHRRHEESWRRFGGYGEVKKRIYRTVVAPWKRQLDEKTPLSASISGIQAPKGVLFHGPSGCGKTLAANCLASSLGLAVVKIRSSDVLDRWLGGSEAILRSIFERARAAAPCILFFDELDAIAANRAASDQSADVSSRLLSTFLNELDGISSSITANVLVVACSNRLDALDAALLRPGRLDEHVLLATPSLSDIQEILKLCTARIPLSDDIDLAEIAKRMSQATGAHVEGICREACYVALRRLNESDRVGIRKSDFDEAIGAWT